VGAEELDPGRPAGRRDAAAASRPCRFVRTRPRTPAACRSTSATSRGRGGACSGSRGPRALRPPPRRGRGGSRRRSGSRGECRTRRPRPSYPASVSETRLRLLTRRPSHRRRSSKPSEKSRVSPGSCSDVAGSEIEGRGEGEYGFVPCHLAVRTHAPSHRYVTRLEVAEPAEERKGRPEGGAPEVGVIAGAARLPSQRGREEGGHLAPRESSVGAEAALVAAAGHTRRHQCLDRRLGGMAVVVGEVVPVSRRQSPAARVSITAIPARVTLSWGQKRVFSGGLHPRTSPSLAAALM
jgi:hypothetical protein